MIYRKANQKDYDTILNIWEESVLATHHFLRDTDREEFKKKYPHISHILISSYGMRKKI